MCQLPVGSIPATRTNGRKSKYGHAGAGITARSFPWVFRIMADRKDGQVSMTDELSEQRDGILIPRLVMSINKSHT